MKPLDAGGIDGCLSAAGRTYAGTVAEPVPLPVDISFSKWMNFPLELFRNFSF
jgi:hypothetical protein